MTTEFSTELPPLLPGEVARPVAAPTINIKRMIRLRAPLMIIVAIVLAVPLAAAIWFLVPAEYEATTIIHIQSTRPSVLQDGRTSMGGEYEKYVETQVNLIHGPTILSKVAQDPAVRDLPWIKSEKDPLHFLMAKLEARMERGTELISVSCKSPDRTAAITIVSKTVEVYMRYVTNLESEGVGQTRRLLVEERDALQKEIEAQRKVIADIKRNASLTVEGQTPTGEIGLEHYHDKLGSAQAELTTAETAIANLEKLVSEVSALQAKQNANPGAPIHEMGIESQVIVDSTVSMLRQQEAMVSQRQADMKGKYLEEAAPLKAQEDALQSVRNQLEQAKSQVRSDALKTLYEKHRSELTVANEQAEGAKARIDQFNQTIQEHEKRISSMAEAMAKLGEEEAQLEQLRNNYDQYVERIRVLDVEERAPGRVDEPSDTTAPEDPQTRKRLQLIMLALIFACGAGLCAGVYREFTDQQIRMPQDLSYVTDLPVLAAIPHSSFDKLPSNANPAMLTADFPESTTSDEFRRIITRVIYPPEGSAELNTVLVAGPSRGDGKTSLACNLAVSLAQANRRVLLVDISARQPSVEKCFGMRPAEGLAEVFAGKCAPKDVVRETKFPNLHILGPGLEEGEMTAKLASREVVEFLEDAEKAYEHVIIDTPPSLLMSDAKLLAPIVDGVILVVGAGVSSVGMVRRCVNEMRQVGANIVGVVLNGIKPTRGGYMRDNLDQYYAYASEAGQRQAPGAPTPVILDRRKTQAADEPASIMLIDDEDDVLAEHGQDEEDGTPEADAEKGPRV